MNGVLSSLDILVPIINEMYGTTNDPYPGNQRSQYDSVLDAAEQAPLDVPVVRAVELVQQRDGGRLLRAGRRCSSTRAAISNRMMQWMDFTYQVTAELYYDTTYAMSHRRTTRGRSQYEFGNNGDGSIWYPGKPSVIGGTHDIPIESIRMKMLREGMQDYEYLNLLVTLGQTARSCRAELAKVVTNAGSFVSDPAILEQVRGQMADEIELMMSTNGTCDAGVDHPPEPGPETSDEGGVGDNEPDNNGSGCNCDAGAMGTTSVPAGFAVLALLMRRRARPRPR